VAAEVLGCSFGGHQLESQSIQTFGRKINLHPHIHCLVTEGGEDSEGRFHHVASFQDSLLAEFFSLEVFALLLGKELISEVLVEKITG
jgi:hypothetical protein